MRICPYRHALGAIRAQYASVIRGGPRNSSGGGGGRVQVRGNFHILTSKTNLLGVKPPNPLPWIRHWIYAQLSQAFCPEPLSTDLWNRPYPKAMKAWCAHRGLRSRKRTSMRSTDLWNPGFFVQTPIVTH